MAVTWDGLEKVQPLATRTLKNSIQKNRIAHAYLLEGERGTGKRDVSNLIAKTLLCLNLQDQIIPCEACINCKRINNGSHPDVHIVEPDGLSIKKDQIKTLQQEFSKSAVESEKKLYTIIHADKMTVNAANSLLKFLEEPNEGTTAILITEQIQQILPTIISRCQVITFRMIPTDVLVNKLLEAGVSSSNALILASITNNIHEALELNNDEWFAQARKLVLKLYEVLRKSAASAMVALQEDWYPHFKEKSQIDRGLDLLLFVYKDLISLRLGKDKQQLLYPDFRNQLEMDVLQMSTRTLTDKMSSILEAKRKLNANMNPQLLMEQLVLKLQGGSTFV
ncbi:DNA polymerase III subunit delta' [Bacillus sp. FJAT-49736]|uniref:DNA polymerase III subunit delta' n=1 Tax=Bacillus sp. FJAT-49736 TaxID=2833582 RepID=UPI001BC9A77A|nr:DNA polymerase III subunit delta' [Bacillus sp. FJAT-49736]MBS4175792.1 DNA polymerase III subunit delta' [Bacillus sp. FJAT-49736]MBS4175882.1 DNA polymerase III subunit delta' [Bacillus sp. FJAT-49736]